MPDLPWRIALGVHALERLQILEGIDAAPEALVVVRHQLALGDEALERRLDQLLAGLDVVEDLAAEDEVAAVDPRIGADDVVDAEHGPVGSARHEMEAVVRAYREEGAGAAALHELVDQGGQRKIGEAVAVIRKEYLLLGEVRLDRLQPLPDIRRD